MKFKEWIAINKEFIIGSELIIRVHKHYVDNKTKLFETKIKWDDAEYLFGDYQISKFKGDYLGTNYVGICVMLIV